MGIGYLDDLQVVARHQAGVTAGVGDFGFPPSIVLEADNGKDIALGEAELLGDGGSVAVHCASCEVKLVYRLERTEWEVNAYQSAGSDVRRG